MKLGKYTSLRIDRSIYKQEFPSLFMPEKDWYSLTVRLSTAKAVKELAKANGVTIDDLLKELIANQNKKWITCSLCGVKVKAVNMSSHMAKMHPR